LSYLLQGKEEEAARDFEAGPRRDLSWKHDLELLIQTARAGRDSWQRRGADPAFRRS